jgi:hypothetical protein
MDSNSSRSRPVRDLTGRKTVAGLFTDRMTAERAINDLKAAGFRGDQIGVAMRDRTEQGQMVEDTGASAASGATTGLLGGGLLGGVVGFLVGVGALAIPGIGPVVAGGVLASTFGIAGGTAVAGAGIGAAAGGVAGALVGLGIPEVEAQHFESGVRSGHTLVTVTAGERTMDALAILERNGADSGPGGVHHGAHHAGEAVTGAATGAIAGGVAGAAVAGPVGAVVGGVVGATAGGATGEAVHHARPADHRDAVAEDTTGGALAGGAAGAIAGTVVGGPVGTVVGGALGAAAGAGTGAAAGAADDDDAEWTTDERGNRVRRTRS